MYAGACILEIGCHTGTTTALLHAAVADSGGRCLGVDVSRSIVHRARELHPEVKFDVCDAWDAVGLLAALGRWGHRPTLLLVDVGGLSGANGFLLLLLLLLQLLLLILPLPLPLLLLRLDYYYYS